MAKAKTINIAQFERQYEENVIGNDGLRPIEIPNFGTVWIKIPLDKDNIVGSVAEEVRDRMVACGDDQEAAALVILDYHPDVSAEDQLALWKESGRTAGWLLHVWQMTSSEVAEKRNDFRYRG